MITTSTTSGNHINSVPVGLYTDIYYDMRDSYSGKPNGQYFDKSNKQNYTATK